jgi:DNA adenine methylase
MTVKRPILWYFGGKWKAAPGIIEWFPPHKVYVELFGGGASVLLRKDQSEIEIYNDIDSDVVNFFRMMRERTGDLLFRLYFTPRSREEYIKCVECDDVDPVEKARSFFVRSWQSYRPSGISAGSWRTNKDKRSRHTQLSLDNLMDVIARLKDVYIENQDFRVVVELYDAFDTLFYIDPPYLKEGKEYLYAMSEQDHIDLACILADVEGYVVISATDSDLYRDLYTDWIWKPLNVQGLRGKAKTEYLIMNYEFEEEDG